MKTTQVYSTACNDGKIVHGIVEYEGVPLKQVYISNRMGEKLCINVDSLDALIVALQNVQFSVTIGV